MESTKTTALGTGDVASPEDEKNGTLVDQDDMRRMGKKQQFKVRRQCTEYIRLNIAADLSRSRLEKYATSCGMEFCISLASDLGISNNVSFLLPKELALQRIYN
jgi:hypothetical protein